MSILCVVQHGKDNRFLCPKVVLANGVLLLDRGHISYGLFIHQLPIDVAILSCLPSPNHKKSIVVFVMNDATGRALHRHDLVIQFAATPDL